MPLKFAANISFMFNEAPNTADRYGLAKEAGFKAVEGTFVYDVPYDDIAAAKKTSGLEHVLVNYSGIKKGEKGLAAVPDRIDDFKYGLEKCIEYAKALGCAKIHVMAGNMEGRPWKAMEETYLKNLTYAAHRLQREGIVGVIEPINRVYSLPDYFMSSVEKAIEVVTAIDHPNIRLLWDSLHMQAGAGNLTHDLNKYWPLVGHVQLSQVPSRHELNYPGELNFQYILGLLEDLAYEDWVGLEYIPSSGTMDSLSWMSAFGYKL